MLIAKELRSLCTKFDASFFVFRAKWALKGEYKAMDRRGDLGADERGFEL